MRHPSTTENFPNNLFYGFLHDSLSGEGVEVKAIIIMSAGMSPRAIKPRHNRRHKLEITQVSEAINLSCSRCLGPGHEKSRMPLSGQRAAEQKSTGTR